MLSVFLVGIFSLALSVSVSAGPVVSTLYGDVEGGQYRTKAGKLMKTFLGIPFASPPIGQLRFKPSIPPRPWDETKMATEFPARCVQPLSVFKAPPAGDSEDCLYLNVFAPSHKTKDGYPVMVWIHGGGFQWGSGYEYGKDNICENLVSRDVVVVVIQYRLNIYGFLSTGDKEATGNWGLWDQLEALRWVKGNIAAFGGNPNQVTIFGESAGGASVSLLSLMPDARHFFHQSIAQSGSAFAFWAIQPQPRRSAEAFAQVVGCHSKDSKLLVECLRAKTVEELTESTNTALKNASDVTQFLSFVPTVDGIILPETLDKLALSQLPKPAIIGTNADEYLTFLKPSPRLNFEKLKQFVEVPNTIEEFEKSMALMMPEMLYRNSVDVARKLARFFYVDSRDGAIANETFIAWRLIEALSDCWFHVPAYRDMLSKRSVGAPVYLYNFAYYGDGLFPKDYQWKGAGHALEMAYEFGVEGSPGMEDILESKFDQNDHHMTNVFCTLLTNFAKYGNPTPEPVAGVKWPVANPLPSTAAIELDLQPSVTSYHKPSVIFWTQTLPEIERTMGQSDA